MKSTYLHAAVAALICATQPMAAVAQSPSEVFALNTSDRMHSNKAPANTGTVAGLGYKVVGDYAIAESDIVLGRVNQAGQVIGDLQRGLGQGGLFDRWTDGIIPYQYSSDVSDEEREFADEAIAQWNQNTSITMVELNDENRGDFSNFLTFQASSGCASYVGMRGGEQELWISASCGVGSIVHEIGHAVGLFHEHTRSDRDNFIQVNQDNIVAGKEFNFDVLTANTELLGEYDYASIMHYGETFFSANGSATITALNGAQIGQRLALSDGDIASVNEMYKTDLSLHVDARDEPENDQVIVDVQVTNEGNMGANQLSLSVEIDGAANWLSLSPGSGWECAINENALQCDRAALGASATSLFTLVAQTSAATASQVKAELIANTRESDYSNNGYNATEEEPVIGAASLDANAVTSTFTSVDSGNELSADSGTQIESRLDLAEASSGGGSMSPLTGFGLFLALVGLRLRRRAS